MSMQVMVFGNLFKFAPLSKDLDDLLMQLMRDENVEVMDLVCHNVNVYLYPALQEEEVFTSCVTGRGSVHIVCYIWTFYFL